LAKILSLKEAVQDLVRDGDTLAIEGFTHLIPSCAGHEIVRQAKKNLTVIRLTPDLVYDQMIGSGCVSKVVFSWGGNPGVGSLHRLRDAYENGWPRPLAIEEHAHAAWPPLMPRGPPIFLWNVARVHRTDLAKFNPNIKSVECPFTERSWPRFRRIGRTLRSFHAQKADKRAMC